jgi:hypothetical protein
VQKKHVRELGIILNPLSIIPIPVGYYTQPTSREVILNR